MKNSLLNLTIVFTCGMFIVLGCSAPKTSDTNAPNAAPANATSPAANSTVSANTASTDEKPIAIKAPDLTKEYDTNELAADKKYKDKMLAVTGKIGNIAETMGNVTVTLTGHNIAKDVMCKFNDADKASVEALKKGQNVTLVGKGDGMTMGLYVGLQNCKIQQ